MKFFPPITFKNLRPHIAEAIKESCYRTDARLYNIANEVHNIKTFSVEPGVEIAAGLSKIVDSTIRESILVGCDVSVITKGILLGAFRASPFMAPEAHKTIKILINEIVQAVFKYKGNIKEAIQGMVDAIVIIAKEFRLNGQEAMIVAREDILSSASALDPDFTDQVKEALRLDAS